jgi:hypothetical protein
LDEYEIYLKSPYRKGPLLSREGFEQAEKRLREIHAAMDLLEKEEYRLCELMGW